MQPSCSSPALHSQLYSCLVNTELHQTLRYVSYTYMNMYSQQTASSSSNFHLISHCGLPENMHVKLNCTPTFSTLLLMQNFNIYKRLSVEVFGCAWEGAGAYQTLSQLRNLLLGLVEAMARSREASSLAHRYVCVHTHTHTHTHTHSHTYTHTLTHTHTRTHSHSHTHTHTHTHTYTHTHTHTHTH